MSTPKASVSRLVPPSLAAASDLLSKGLLLELFDEPIAFNRAYVSIAGSVTAALMLAHAMTSQQDWDAQAWFERSNEVWAEQIGLTRFEQATARRLLRERGLLEERRAGFPARLYFRINLELLVRLLRKQAEQRWQGIL